jgi:HSP20 family protein
MSDKSASVKNRFLRPRDAVNRTQAGQVRVVLEMPGVSKDGLEVKIENNELRVLGRRDHEKTVEGTHILRERARGDYLMTYTLDETVDTSKVDALLENGILTLTLELKEAVKPRTIQVRAG